MESLKVMDIITPTNKGYNVKKVISRGVAMDRDERYNKSDNLFSDELFVASNRKKNLKSMIASLLAAELRDCKRLFNWEGIVTMCL